MMTSVMSICRIYIYFDCLDMARTCGSNFWNFPIDKALINYRIKVLCCSCPGFAEINIINQIYFSFNVKGTKKCFPLLAYQFLRLCY